MKNLTKDDVTNKTYTTIEGDGYTYDVVFHGESWSQNKGFRLTRQEAIDFITTNNGTDDSYFADADIAQVVCNDTGDVAYEEDVRHPRKSVAEVIMNVDEHDYSFSEFEIGFNNGSGQTISILGYDTLDEAAKDQLADILDDDEIEFVINEMTRLYAANKPKEIDAYIEPNSDLELIEVTHGTNGYPSRLYKAVIGFDEFAQAEEFAARCNGEIAIFHKRDGWQLWEHREWACKPIDLTIGLDGCWCDNPADAISILNDSRAGINAELKEGYITAEEAEARIKVIDNSIKTINEDWADGKIVDMYNGDYVRVIDHYTMAYSEDTHNYAIGVRIL